MHRVTAVFPEMLKGKKKKKPTGSEEVAVTAVVCLDGRTGGRAIGADSARSSGFCFFGS